MHQLSAPSVQQPVGMSSVTVSIQRKFSKAKSKRYWTTMVPNRKLIAAACQTILQTNSNMAFFLNQEDGAVAKHVQHGAVAYFSI